MSKKISLADWQQQLAGSAATEHSMANQPAKTAQADLVYSTAGGRIKAEQSESLQGERYADGALRIKRETKGRGGKTVLTITGLTGTTAELTTLCTELKKKCACGGAVKDGVIEIQADKREFVAELLQQKGYKVKQAGG
ncbi:hypothetical protein GCM10010919_18310 [Alishewanella longhuensis]|uniref:SUI1 domain-containing protein n=1 Tax=Alishewanella longhuensis TaxID=1091037 RepID=A0ABQ3L2A1_9ALTE|nr:hypothetical protein GCM10010919_18310 [Alishewanella longhuensis]